MMRPPHVGDDEGPFWNIMTPDVDVIRGHVWERDGKDGTDSQDFQNDGLAEGQTRLVVDCRLTTTTHHRIQLDLGLKGKLGLRMLFTMS